MTVTSVVKTLSTSAQKIATGGTKSSGSNRFPHKPNAVVLTAGSAEIHIGGSAVDVTDGTILAIAEKFSIELSPGDDLYAIAGSGTPTITVMTTDGGAVA